MKAQKFNLITGLLLLFSIGLSAQEGIEKKITKEFAADANTDFTIVHKFGDINIENWDQEKIVVEATLIADTKKQEKAEKLFDQVEIEFLNQGNKIKVETMYNSKLDQKDIKVNYIIRMPVYVALSLTNKFGSAFINELSGITRIDISYGNLKANKLLLDDDKQISQLVLAYGKAEINSCNWQQINVKYSTVQIKKAKAILIDSRFSTIEIDESHSIISTSKYDNYECGNTQNLVLTSKFSNLGIGNISNKLDLDFEYGNFKVGNIQAGFEQIKITNKYGDINLKIDENSSYFLDAHVQYCDLNFPENNSVTHKENGTENYYKGLVGKGSSSESKVTIQGKYGSIDLD